MSSTLETINNSILMKIMHLTDALNILVNYTDYGVNDNVKSYLVEIKDLLNHYELSSANILADYFALILEHKNNINRLQTLIDNKKSVEAADKSNNQDRTKGQPQDQTRDHESDKLEELIEQINHINDDNDDLDKLLLELKNEKDKFNKTRENYFIEYRFFLKKEGFIDNIDRYYINISNFVDNWMMHVIKPVRKQSIDSSTRKATIEFTKNNYKLMSKVKSVYNPNIPTDKRNEMENKIIKVRSIFSLYENLSISRSIDSYVYNKCSQCNDDMKIIANLSEIVCTNCGVTENLRGTILEDEQFYYQEGQRVKHGSYDPSKHCKFWIERIQARESRDIPQSVLDAVTNCIKHNNIRNIEDISYSEIRKYLSQTKNTIYNEHVPLIRKIITGESPAQLTDQKLQTIQVYFDKVIRIYEEIKPVNKTNVPYHPYLIYKIIEHIYYTKISLENNESKKRIISVMSCIHLQNRETLIENDKTWSKICNRIDDITYRPTDRNLH